MKLTLSFKDKGTRWTHSFIEFSTKTYFINQYINIRGFIKNNSTFLHDESTACTLYYKQYIILDSINVIIKIRAIFLGMMAKVVAVSIRQTITPSVLVTPCYMT